MTMHNKHNSDWQQQLREAVSDQATLFELLDIPFENAAQVGLASTPEFPLKVPRAYLARIQKGQLDDPLLRQILPLQAESYQAANERDDAGCRRAATSYFAQSSCVAAARQR